MNLLTLHGNALLADVMFKSAREEDSNDLANMVNMILLAKRYQTMNLTSLVDSALGITDATKLSVYYLESAVIFGNDLENIRKKLEQDEMFVISSRVLLNYIARKLNKEEENKAQILAKEHLSNMQNAIALLEHMAVVTNSKSI